MSDNFVTITSTDWEDYALLDSGRGRKLEQFGPYRLIRPEPRAVWKPAAGQEQWDSAHAEYIPAEPGGGGKWQRGPDLPDRWEIGYRDLRMLVEIESSRQVGVFPENASHWDWIGRQVNETKGECRVLNLFGYTGIASLAAASAGAAVTHVDSSKRAITLGREDQALNGLEEAEIRWIVDDALKFTQREIRRGRCYEGFILDPPQYGLGPNRERWTFEEGFDELCGLLKELWSDSPRFVVVTAYALDSSPEVLKPGLDRLLGRLGGTTTYGTLTVVEKSAGRKIDLSLTARWSSD